jgi:hypothetical protein
LLNLVVGSSWGYRLELVFYRGEYEASRYWLAWTRM